MQVLLPLFRWQSPSQGEALVRTLRDRDTDVVGLDTRPSTWTSIVGSVADAEVALEAMVGVDVVLHTATLHKPQLAFLPRQAFVDTNVSGTLALLEAAADADVQAFVMSSSTTVFEDALIPAPGEPASWIDESVVPVPKNIYGVTKAAAEDLCQLAFRNHGLPCVVLRAARFFPEPDGAPDAHERRCDDNGKAGEYASRRVALEDGIDAHMLALRRAPHLGFRRYVISATTPFRREDLPQLRIDASAVFTRRAQAAAAVWAERGWRFPSRLDRVYVNSCARQELGRRPRFDLDSGAQMVAEDGTVGTLLSRTVGSKEYVGSTYHRGTFRP